MHPHAVRLVALDTSILGDTCRDLFSRDIPTRIRASTFIKSLREQGVVPVLCWHHVEELLAHNDIAVARDRFRFLQSLPVVAWVRCYGQPGYIGSIVDIFAHEAEVAFGNPALDALGVRNLVRQNLFEYGSGLQAMAVISEYWQLLRPLFRERAERAREIVAISGAKHLDFSKEKVSTFLSGSLRSATESAKVFEWLYNGLQGEISSRGDQRIPDAAAVAANFMREVATEGDDIGESKDDRIQYLSRYGIYPDDLVSDMHMGDVFNLAKFRSRLKIIRKSLNIPWETLVATVGPERIPSALLGNALRQYGQDLPERKGSDLADGHLATLGFYADNTYVDKRTAENMRRATLGDDSIKTLLRHFDKAGPYFGLAKKIKMSGAHPSI